MNRLLFFLPFFIFATVSSSLADSTTFVKVAPESSGVSFVNLLPETPELNVLRYQYYYNGAGVSLADFNQDGLLDIYLVGNLVQNKLYLNKGGLKFQDVTKKAAAEGIAAWATGSTIVDINSDGWPDIYISQSGRFDPPQRKNLLLVNNKDGTFREEAAKYGIDDSSYSTPSLFFDFDRDGDLDLFLLNHPIRSSEHDGVSSFEELRGTRDPYAGDKLYRNDKGKFTDISAEAGIIGNQFGYGWGWLLGT